MANRYWVGGAGTWDLSDTTHWSTASNGAGGASVPTAADAVIFDASSGNGEVVIGANVPCLTLNMSAYTGTLNFGTNKISASGTNTTVFTGGTSCTITGTPLIDCISTGTTGTRTIASGVVTESNSISFNVSAGAGNLSITGTNAIRSLDLTGYSGAVANTTFTIYGNLNISATSAFAAGSSTITFAATSGTKTITTNGVSTDRPFTFNGVGGTFQLQDNCTVGSTRTVTLTNGTLDLNNKTLSTGLFSSTNSNTRSIAFGTGKIELTGSNATIWTNATGTGFSYTGTSRIEASYSGSTGTRQVFPNTFATSSEGTALNFYITNGSDVIAFSSTNRRINTIDFTGFSGTFTNSQQTVHGNYIISTGMTVGSGTNATTFAATSGTKTITTSGKTLDFPITFDGVGGSWSFSDALTQGSTQAFTITNGTVKLKAGVTSTVGAFATSGSNQKYLQSTLAGFVATLSQTSGTVSVNNLTIQDITVTGGATWQAFLTSGNVNGGNNTGWDWYYEPGEYMYTRRKTKRLLIQ